VGSRVHLINPSDLAFGVAVITPRWLYVLAATGSRWGDPDLVDETLNHFDPRAFAPGDVVEIGIHTDSWRPLSITLEQSVTDTHDSGLARLP
jgi:hypothetical protein